MSDPLKKPQIAERRKSSGDSETAEKDFEQTERRRSMRISQAPRRIINDEADKVEKIIRRQSLTATILKPEIKPSVAKMSTFQQHIKEKEEEQAVIKIVKPKIRRKSISKDRGSKTADLPQSEPTWNFIKMMFDAPAPNPIELFGPKGKIIAKRTTLDGKHELLVQQD